MTYLRPYQIEIRDAVLRELSNGSRTTLYVVPTGCGKTQIALDTIDQWPDKQCHVLCLAHRQELIWQPWNRWEQKTGEHANIEMSELHRSPTRSRLTFASKDSLHAGRLRQSYPDPKAVGLIWVDECFPAGTLVDGHPIETIQPGDVIKSYDHQQHAVSPKSVLHVMSRPAPAKLIRLTFDDGGLIVCTPNHPFCVPLGGSHEYVPAAMLCLGDMVLTISSVKGDADALRYLRTADQTTHQISREQVSTDVLQGMPSQSLFTSYGTHKSPGCIGEDDRTQSDGSPGRSSESLHATARNAMEASCSGWQWPPSYTSPAVTVMCLGVADRGCGANSNSKGFWLPDLLQARYRQSGAEDRDRSRWTKPSSAVETGAGQEETEIPGIARLVCAEVLERGDLEFGRYCGRDGLVYNLEVEDNHNYFAEGILVHNCHHLARSNKSYAHILDYFLSANPDCRMFGCTATPDRADEKALGAVFETVAAEYPLLDPAGGPSAIADGWLVPIEQEIVFVEELEFERVGSRGGDFIDSQLQKMLIENKAVEKLVAATRQIAGDSTTLMFTSGIEQAILQAGILNAERDGSAYAIASRIPPEMACAWVVNSNDTESRRRILKRWSRGEFPYFSNCAVFTEGMDEPRIACVSMGRPTKSRPLYAQMVGRGTRVLPEVIEGTDEHGERWRLETPEERLTAIASSAKPRLIVLDFVGNSRHPLISAADILGGSYEDDVVEGAKNRIKGGEKDVQKALELAKQDAVLLARQKLRAKATVHRTKVDPFVVLHVAERREPGWHRGRKPTPRQIAALQKFRLEDAEITKLSFQKASDLLDALIKRARQGLCTYRQAKTLEKAGYDSEQVPFEGASAMIDCIKHGRTVPTAGSILDSITAAETPLELTIVARNAAKFRGMFTVGNWDRIVAVGHQKRQKFKNGEQP